jgi:hypothetical protein
MPSLLAPLCSLLGVRDAALFGSEPVGVVHVDWRAGVVLHLQLHSTSDAGRFSLIHSVLVCSLLGGIQVDLHANVLGVPGRAVLPGSL